MRRLTATVASLVLLLGVAHYAAAKGGVPAGAGGCAKKINLVASAAGKAIAARGTAAVRTAAKIGFVQQNFEVSMRAAVADGTTFMVFANGLPARTITSVLGNGVLALDNVPPTVLPAGVGARWDGVTMRVSLNNMDPARFPAGCSATEVKVGGIDVRGIALAAVLSEGCLPIVPTTTYVFKKAGVVTPGTKVELRIQCVDATGLRHQTQYAGTF